jgi:DNA polymerase III alpha subunit
MRTKNEHNERYTWKVLMKYIPLRIHSIYSKGTGVVEPGVLGDFLARQKINFMAISDPFSLKGWESFRLEACGRGMKPLLGIEIRIKEAGALLLYPTSHLGYKSIVQSYNKKVFTRMNDVAVIFLFRKERTIGVEKFILGISRYVNPQHFFLGLDWRSPRWILNFANKYNLPLVWANPLKWVYNYEKYAVARAVFKHHSLTDMLEGSDAWGLSFSGPINDHSILRRWGDAGREAMKNTFKFARRIGFNFTGIQTSQAGCQAGQSKLQESVQRVVSGRRITKVERKRISRELMVINKLGFSAYFLIALEIGKYCKANNIYFNLRGSCVSSFLLYILGLSYVNPLEYNLLFERFLNSYREALPDIDIDIDSSRRSQVLEWIFKKYEDKVVFVSTHKFFRARSALYEVVKIHGFNSQEAQRFSEEIPELVSPSYLKGKGKGHLEKIYKRAALLDGVYKECSLHLGGVLFSRDAIKEIFPIDKSPLGFKQIPWDKETVARLKLFKLDLLGIRSFDVISPIAANTDVDFLDQEVWETIQKAKTIGCFQQESPLAREALQQLCPRDLYQLAITIAIIRPGPAKSGMKYAYINKKAPIHPVLSKIFPSTGGNLIFEEQISILIHTITGWSLDWSEKVRRDIKTGNAKENKTHFLKAGESRGWKVEEMCKLWKLIVDFSRYAFNQGHSIAFAHSAYLSSWLKTKNPVTFFNRLLNAGGGYYPLFFYVEEAKKWGIRILPPDVNMSTLGFKEEEDSIRVGLLSIKGIGISLASKILSIRGLGFESLEDFVSRTKIGERELASLLAVASLDSLGVGNLTEAQKKKNWRQYLGFIP